MASETWKVEDRKTLHSTSFEINTKSSYDLQKLANTLSDYWDSESIEQFIFVLQQINKEDFANHCNIATQKLGIMLAENYGAEKSFFDLSQNKIKYQEFQSTSTLNKVGYYGNFHSIGALIHKNAGQTRVVLIDLTYYTVNSSHTKKNSVWVGMTNSTEFELSATLNSHYDGSWEKVSEFDPRTKKYRACV